MISELQCWFGASPGLEALVDDAFVGYTFYGDVVVGGNWEFECDFGLGLYSAPDSVPAGGSVRIHNEVVM